MESIRGKVAIITGAANGIGRATANYFAEYGCSLALVDLDRASDDLSRVKDECTQKGLSQDQVLLIIADLALEEQRQDIVKKTIDKFGQLDILVNNAGIAQRSRIGNVNMADMKRLFEINLFASFDISQMAVPHLKKTKGCIVNVSSISSQELNVYMPAYCMSKAALDMQTRAFAAELAVHGVRCNSVHPGHVNGTRILHNCFNMTDSDALWYEEDAKRAHPLGPIFAEDVAKSIGFFASDLSSRVSGNHHFVASARNVWCIDGVPHKAADDESGQA